MASFAIGINDIAGTGFYSSEYIVASYGINRTDFHFGIGWGALDNQKRISIIHLVIFMMDSIKDQLTILKIKEANFNLKDIFLENCFTILWHITCY